MSLPKDIVPNETSLWTGAIYKALPRPIADVFISRRDVIQIMDGYYMEPHRFYHTPRHILECVQEANHFEFEFPGEGYLAILIHDAAYDIGESDMQNVIDSAKIAEEEASAFVKGFKMLVPGVVKKNVMATSHIDEHIIDADSALIADIDMSILSSSPIRYQIYAKDIMSEFSTKYSLEQYTAGRKLFLESAIAKADLGFLYHTPMFKLRTAQAIKNMTWEMSNL